MPKNAVQAASFRLLTYAVDDPAVDQAAHVVAQAERQVVRPELDERREDRHAEHRQHAAAQTSDAVDEHRARRSRARGCGTYGTARAPRICGLLPALHVASRRRTRAPPAAAAAARRPRPLEVLLADHLLEDVDRQHVEVAADHLRDAEVGDRPSVKTTIAARIRPYFAPGSVMVKNLRRRRACRAPRPPRTAARRRAAARSPGSSARAGRSRSTRPMTMPGAP